MNDPYGRALELKTLVWAHVELNIHTDGYIEKYYRYVYIYGLVCTHIFSFCNLKGHRHNNTAVAMSRARIQNLISDTNLQ